MPFCFISFYFVYLTMIYFNCKSWSHHMFVVCLFVRNWLKEISIKELYTKNLKSKRNYGKCHLLFPTEILEKYVGKRRWQRRIPMLKVDYFFAFFILLWISRHKFWYLALEHYLVSSYQAGMYHLRNSYVIYLLSKSDDLLTLYLNILVARPWATNHVYCDSYTLLKGDQSFLKVSIPFI